MHFTPAGVDEFLAIFKEHEEAIRNFPGCTYLALLRDADEPYTFATISHWRDAECLQKYRQSELFSSVWGRVKSLFAQRSQAFSLIDNDSASA
jgi:quinol monooxygenase YgiN